MSLRLEAAESAAERIVYEQIDAGIQELGDRRRNPHKAIHSARQRCKRIRAVLRLMRCDLGDQYGLENVCFRDIARGLSGVRDAEAVIEALDKLQPHCNDKRESGLVRATRRGLTTRRQQDTDGEEGLKAHADAAIQGFRAARERPASWPLSAQGFALVGPGLRKTYAGGRNAFTKACREPTDLRFHEMRKRVKYLWYQMRVLHPVWPEAMRAYRRSLHKLSNLLGDDHDLLVVRESLREQPDILRGARNLECMVSLIERRQCRLKAEARLLGMRVFAERSREFRKRLARYWQTWQAEMDAAVAHPQAAPVDAREVA
ncbi:MAG: CHAD domain-containing protein [Gammaproteobacteria bacterium]|nr:CHAD domain-containing protein [Gammaproteobacteria bacterium]